MQAESKRKCGCGHACLPRPLAIMRRRARTRRLRSDLRNAATRTLICFCAYHLPLGGRKCTTRSGRSPAAPSYWAPSPCRVSLRSGQSDPWEIRAVLKASRHQACGDSEGSDRRGSDQPHPRRSTEQLLSTANLKASPLPALILTHPKACPCNVTRTGVTVAIVDPSYMRDPSSRRCIRIRACNEEECAT